MKLIKEAVLFVHDVTLEGIYAGVGLGLRNPHLHFKLYCPGASRGRLRRRISATIP